MFLVTSSTVALQLMLCILHRAGFFFNMGQLLFLFILAPDVQGATQTRMRTRSVFRVNCDQHELQKKYTVWFLRSWISPSGKPGFLVDGLWWSRMCHVICLYIQILNSYYIIYLGDSVKTPCQIHQWHLLQKYCLSYQVILAVKRVGTDSSRFLVLVSFLPFRVQIHLRQW